MWMCAVTRSTTEHVPTRCHMYSQPCVVFVVRRVCVWSRNSTTGPFTMVLHLLEYVDHGGDDEAARKDEDKPVFLQSVHRKNVIVSPVSHEMFVMLEAVLLSASRRESTVE